MYTLIKGDKSPVLCDLDLVSRVENAKREAEEALSRIPSVLSSGGYPVTEEYLSGIFANGVSFLERKATESVREWTKNSPLAEASINRLCREAVEAIPAEVKTTIKDALRDTEKALTGCPERERAEDFIFAEGMITIADAFVERNRNSEKVTIPVTKELLKTEKDLREVIVKVRELEDMGFNVLDVKGVSLSGQPINNPGILSHFVGSRFTPEERPELDEESLLLSMINNKGRTKKQRDDIRNKYGF